METRRTLLSLVVAATLAAACLFVPSAHAGEALAKGSESGFALPRFVSLSASKVHVRRGPSFSHKVKWTYHKAGLPVEITAEYGNWRRIRDADGEDGWVHHSLLSGARTALISPWSDGPNIPLLSNATTSARTLAYLEPLVVAQLERCDGAWCTIRTGPHRGHVPQNALYGVYAAERLD